MPNQEMPNDHAMDMNNMPVRYFVKGEVVFCLAHQEQLNSELERFVFGPDSFAVMRPILNLAAELLPSTAMLQEVAAGLVNEIHQNNTQGFHHVKDVLAEKLEGCRADFTEGPIANLLTLGDDEIQHKLITFYSARLGSYLSFIFARVEAKENPLEDETLSLWTSAVNVALFPQGPPENLEIGGENRLLAAMPSWFNAPEMGDIISGGPGGEPVPPAADPQIPASNGILGADLRVLVLDSIPSIPRLHWARQEFTGNLLLQDMLKGLAPVTNFATQYVNQRGDVRLDYYAYDEAQDHEFFVPSLLGLKQHHYDMADHGLFVASLIRQKVAHRTLPIHLIQVLNAQGVGTLPSLLSGLSKARALLWQAPDKRTLINCSFGLTIPSLPLKVGNPDWFLQQNSVALIYAFFKGNHAQIDGLLALSAFVEELTTSFPNTLMFASTGNDSEAGVDEYDARYPARFPAVVGVAAVAAGGPNPAHASYSNYPADVQAYVYGKGGQLQHGTRKTDPASEVVGLFTNRVYTGMEPNEIGWAAWAGTSFATPNALGAVARELMDQPASAPRNMLDNMKIPAEKIDTDHTKQVPLID